MTTDALNPMERIRKSAEELIAVRPAYEEIIPFYRELILAQEESKQLLDLPPIIISEETLKQKHESGLPLIGTDEFIIDPNHATRLLEKICLIAQKKAPALEESAESICEILQEQKEMKERSDGEETSPLPFDPDKLFQGLIAHDMERLKSSLEELQVLEEHLVLLAFSAITPAIETCAEQLGTYLPPDLHWDKGSCPICGSLPKIGYLNENGERHLICGFCLHDWKIGRNGCALCRNTDKDRQHYFYSEEEKEYRVDLCFHCKKYLKLVDLREMHRSFYPQLELIATLHLDMQAMEQGFSTVIDR